MHHEYAVQPAAIGSSWGTFRYVFEKFGFQKGRLISRFPRTWSRLVIEAAEEAGVGDLAHARIVEKLRQARQTAFIRTGRDYDPDLGNWVENALASHATMPFRGIIAHDGRPEDTVISLADLDAEHNLMEAPTSQDIPRTAVDLARACHLLLFAAREIDLVDPFFDIGIGGEDYCGPLEQMMSGLHTAGKENVCVRIHYRAHRNRPSQTEIVQDPGRWINVTLPEDYELHLYAWAQRPDGEDLHDRFILCDCGGIMVGAGFAASGAQENATFTLLDDAHVQELRSKFAAGATVYTQTERAVRVNSNGEAEFI